MSIILIDFERKYIYDRLVHTLASVLGWIHFHRFHHLPSCHLAIFAIFAILAISGQPVSKPTCGSPSPVTTQELNSESSRTVAHGDASCVHRSHQKTALDQQLSSSLSRSIYESIYLLPHSDNTTLPVGDDVHSLAESLCQREPLSQAASQSNSRREVHLKPTGWDSGGTRPSRERAHEIRVQCHC